MPFKIRTKLLIAFLSIIFPFIAVVGTIALYNTSTIHKASLKAEAISEELHAVLSLQLAMDKALMPGNDYIITGDKKYIDEFNATSGKVEELMKKVEETLVVLKGMDTPEVMEKTEIFKSVRTAWQNIKEVSQKIFEIPNPAGSKEAARLMEEMDYRWAYPAIQMLDRHHEIDRREHAEAVEKIQSGWRMAWVTMIGGAAILIAFGVFFAIFYSRLFTLPIEAIHNGADAIARGDFKTRLDIKTGDELQQLAGAMNEMAEQLDSFYGTLERQVEDKTRELKESEKLLKLQINRMPVGYIVWDISFRVMSWNPAAEQIFGFTLEEAKGKHPYDLIVPKEAQPHVDNVWRRLLEGDATAHSVNDNLTKDGRTIICEWTNTPLRYHNGDIIGALSMVQDITERKKAEEALKESETRYKGLIESVTDYIFTVQIENGRPVKTTHGQGCVAITGYASKEYETNPNLWLHMVHEGDRDAVVRQGEAVLSGKAEPLEHRIIAKGGRIKWVRNVSVPHYDEKGQMVSYDGLISDITGRKEAEETLERAKKEWEATFDGITDPLFIHDKELNVVRANRAYQVMAGIRFEEFIGKPYYEVFPKMEKPFRICLKALELQEKEEEEEEEEEFFYPLTNRFFKVRFYPIKDANGKYLYSIHIIEDITEAKRAEERIKEEMEVTSHLLMIAEATAHTTDIDRLMEQVTHCTCKILRCDISLAYLWDEEAKVFQPSQVYGLSHEMIPVFRTEPVDKNMEFVSKVVLISPRLQAEGGVIPWFPDISTLAAIPLVGKTGRLGLIIGIYSKPIEITERDKKIMVGISQQVSVALEQARFYKESVDRTLELSHKIETINVMHEIDRSILSTLKADELLETVTRLISKVIPCERATVSLVDIERGGVIYKAGFGTAAVQKGVFVPFADTSARVLLETGRAEYVSNLPEMRPLLPLEKRFLDEGFLSHIRVPIRIKGDVAGVLTVGAKRVAAFTKENLSTLEYLCSQIGVALSNAGLISDLEELFIGVVKSLSSAIDAKSPWTAGHSARVTKYALDIAKQMGLSEKELKGLELTGLLHDVGKIGTYEAILDKPDKLTPEEQAVMRLHPVRGAEILAPIKQLKEIIPGVKYHHEFYDGTGYPDGLEGEAIPLHARILTVADTVDAMGADRPYREGRGTDVIVAELKRCSGTQFDPKVVEALLNVIGEEEFKMAAS